MNVVAGQVINKTTWWRSVISCTASEVL